VLDAAQHLPNILAMFCVDVCAAQVCLMLLQHSLYPWLRAAGRQLMQSWQDWQP
jgi:hypothetical protein